MNTQGSNFLPHKVRREQVLKAIVDYAVRHGGLTPGKLWLSKKVGISPSVVHFHTENLVEEGVLTKTDKGKLWIADSYLMLPPELILRIGESND